MNINWNILIAEIIWIIIYEIRNYISYLYVFISANIRLSLKFLKWKQKLFSKYLNKYLNKKKCITDI